jgi:hypothetical protein
MVEVIQPRGGAAVAPWWLSGGISAADVAGVWQPKGAASLAASYLRLAGDQGNANIDPAIVGGVAPGFGADGWVGGTSYLRSGILPASGWSGIVRFSDFVANATSQYLFSSFTAPNYFGIQQYKDARIYYDYGTYEKYALVPLTSGVLAIAGTRCYRNGVDEGITSASWSGGANTVDIKFMAWSGGTILFWTGKVQAIAIYKTTISAAQVAAVTTAVNLL